MSGFTAEEVSASEFRDEGRQWPPRFTLIPFNQIRRASTCRYLVKGLIPREGLVVVWGPPKCGKSFWAFDLTLHVALGWEYRGRRVQQGKVVYLALEGQDGFGARADAFRQRHLDADSDVAGFYLITQKTDLIYDHQNLIECIQSQGDGAASAIVIDTMNRSLVGSESKDADMAAYIKAADAIREAFKCAVIIIHHCGIDGTRPRGHTSLTGAADVQIAIRRDSASNIITEVECAKDMPEGAVIASRLEVIELGYDDDGDEERSCVVVSVEDGVIPEKPVKAKPKAMPKKARIALRALGEAIDECGEVITSNHVPDKAKTVSEEIWRSYAYKRGISDGGDRAKQKAFKTAREDLVALCAVGTWDDRYWLVREA